MPFLEARVTNPLYAAQTMSSIELYFLRDHSQMLGYLTEHMT